MPAATVQHATLTLIDQPLLLPLQLITAGCSKLLGTDTDSGYYDDWCFAVVSTVLCYAAQEKFRHTALCKPFESITQTDKAKRLVSSADERERHSKPVQRCCVLKAVLWEKYQNLFAKLIVRGVWEVDFTVR